MTDNNQDGTDDDTRTNSEDNNGEFPSMMNSSNDESTYTTPPHKVQTDENGEPDYEATVEAMDLEYDTIYRIGNDRYRYRGHRTDDVMVEPLSRYTDIAEDALRIEYVWGVYQEGDVEAIDLDSESGMVADVETEPGTTTVNIEPDSARDSHVYFDVEGMPDLSGFYLDYHHGDNKPMVYIHDADSDRVAFEILLPNDDTQKARLVCDRERYYPQNIPDEMKDDILGDEGNRSIRR